MGLVSTALLGASRENVQNLGFIVNKTENPLSLQDNETIDI